MRATAIFAITAVSAAVLCGQTPAQQDQDRVFDFVNTAGAQQVQEIATVVRSIGDIRQLTVDATERTMSVQGTPDQIALAGWLLEQLDQPRNQQASSSRSSAVLEYRMLDAGDDNVVRVFYAPYAKTVQELQEVTVVVRATADIRRMFAYNGGKVVAARATAGQIALAAWLFDELGTPADPSPASPEYRVAGGNDDVARVLRAPHTKTVRDFMELVTAVRSVADLRRTFTYSRPREIALRGAADRVALAAWLVNELDGSGAHGAVSEEYQIADARGEGIVQVFYLPAATTVDDFQRTAAFVRITADIRLAFTYSPARALALRGSATQIAYAAELIAERTKSQ